MIPFEHGDPGRAEHVVEPGEADRVGAFHHRDQARQLRLQHLHAALGAAVDDDLARHRIDALDLRDVRQLLDPEPAGNARADLCRVAIDRLLAAEHHVDRVFGADRADRRSDRIRGGQRVRAGKHAIGDQDGVVGAIRHAFAQRIGRHLGAHADHGDTRAELIADPQRLFERNEVERIDDGGHALPHDRVGDRMHPDLTRIGYLLDTDDNMHRPTSGIPVPFYHYSVQASIPDKHR